MLHSLLSIDYLLQLDTKVLTNRVALKLEFMLRYKMEGREIVMSVGSNFFQRYNLIDMSSPFFHSR